MCASIPKSQNVQAESFYRDNLNFAQIGSLNPTTYVCKSSWQSSLLNVVARGVL